MRVNVPEGLIDDFERQLQLDELVQDRRIDGDEEPTLRPDYKSVSLSNAVRRWGYIA